MTAPTTHWSTTGRLHTGTVDGCEACEAEAGKGRQSDSLPPLSDLQPLSVPLSDPYAIPAGTAWIDAARPHDAQEGAQ